MPTQTNKETINRLIKELPRKTTTLPPTVTGHTTVYTREQTPLSSSIENVTRLGNETTARIQPSSENVKDSTRKKKYWKIQQHFDIIFFAEEFTTINSV